MFLSLLSQRNMFFFAGCIFVAVDVIFGYSDTSLSSVSSLTHSGTGSHSWSSLSLRLLRDRREAVGSSSDTSTDHSVKSEQDSLLDVDGDRLNNRFLEVSQFELPVSADTAVVGSSISGRTEVKSKNHHENVNGDHGGIGSRGRKIASIRSINIRSKRQSSESASGKEGRSVTEEDIYSNSVRNGKAANNYHALFEHYDMKGNPIGLNLENFVESGGCNILPPSWQRRVSGARVCTGCIRLYQGRECTGKRSSDLASWNGCTFFQLYHFNDQAVSVGACQ